MIKAYLTSFFYKTALTLTKNGHVKNKDVAMCPVKGKSTLSVSMYTHSAFSALSALSIGVVSTNTNGNISDVEHIVSQGPSMLDSKSSINMIGANGITISTINGIEGITVIIILSLLLSIVLITLSYLLSIRKWDAEKLSPYECGFEPFGDAKQKFDIRYYLVSLLFILFDLEVSYLFPLIAVDHSILTDSGYIIGAIFIVILTVGFIYEYSKEALDNI
jgi:NADH-quinone oxidoreductase subunit A